MDTYEFKLQHLGTNMYTLKAQIFKLVLMISLFCSFSSNSTAATNQLVQMLTSQLGVTELQATQGMNALINLAKQHISTVDYAKLINGVPELSTLIAAATATAPTTSVPANAAATNDWLNYATSMLGNKSVSDLVLLTQTFSQWGLSADMVGKFFKIALDYVNGIGGAELMKILAGGLQL
jgi:hypothetical protein